MNREMDTPPDSAHPATWRRILGESAAVAVLRGVQGGLMLLTFVAAARWLGTAAYGRVATTLATAGLLAVVVQLGLPGLFLREAARQDASASACGPGALLREGLRASGLAALLLAGLAALGWWLTGPWPPGVIALALGVVAAGPLAWLRVLDGWRQARGRVVAGQLGDSLFRPLALILLIGAGWHAGVAPDGVTAAGGVVAALLLALAGSAAAFPVRDPPRGAARAAYGTRRLVAAGAPFLGLGVLHAVMANADVLMLSVLTDADSAGVYHLAARLTLSLGLGLAAVNAALAPRLARHAASGDDAALSRLAGWSARILALPTALALPLVAVHGGTVLSALFGGDIGAGREVLVALWLGQAVNMACGPVAVVLGLRGHEGVALWGVALGAGVNLVLNALLIPPFGAPGAAVATATSLAAWNLLLLRRLRRDLGLDTSLLGRAARGAVS
jgi:O-antigen/teichoic acid export membrane protein